MKFIGNKNQGMNGLKVQLETLDLSQYGQREEKNMKTTRIQNSQGLCLGEKHGIRAEVVDYYNNPLSHFLNLLVFLAI